MGICLLIYPGNSVNSRDMLLSTRKGKVPPQRFIERYFLSVISNKYASVVGRTTYIMVQKERKIKVENIILKIYIPMPF
jgi:hypothetical protein